MKTTRMFVLCVCVTFILGSTEGDTVSGNNTETTSPTQPTVTMPLPDHNSTHVTSNNHTGNTVTTSPPAASSHSTNSSNTTAAVMSSQMPQASTGTTHNSGVTSSANHKSTTQHAGSSTGAMTTKGGTAALFRGYSQLLVPVISILLYSA